MALTVLYIIASISNSHVRSWSILVILSISKIHAIMIDIGWSGVDWIGLAQDRYRWRALVNSVMNLRVP
jgi:hypothetical protein